MESGLAQEFRKKGKNVLSRGHILSEYIAEPSQGLTMSRGKSKTGVISDMLDGEVPTGLHIYDKKFCMALKSGRKHSNLSSLDKTNSRHLP